jgi:hypothetical protein
LRRNVGDVPDLSTLLNCLPEYHRHSAGY